MLAVGEGMVGVICSETILGDGASVLAGGAVLCVGADSAGFPSAELLSGAGAGLRAEVVAEPARGLCAL